MLSVRAVAMAVASRRSLPHGSRRGSSIADLFRKLKLIRDLICNSSSSFLHVRRTSHYARVHRSLLSDGTATFVPQSPTHRSANASWALAYRFHWGSPLNHSTSLCDTPLSRLFFLGAVNALRNTRTPELKLLRMPSFADCPPRVSGSSVSKLTEESSPSTSHYDYGLRVSGARSYRRSSSQSWSSLHGELSRPEPLTQGSSLTLDGKTVDPRIEQALSGQQLLPT